MQMKTLLWSALVAVFFQISYSRAEDSDNKIYDPCCSYPCQNFGICNRIGFTDRYSCDCAGSSYYGENCEHPTWKKWISNLLRPTPFTVQKLLTSGKYVWKVINNISFLRRFVMKKVLYIRAFSPPWPEEYTTAADYPTWEGYSNKSYYARTLPPVLKNCPTPMGIAGPKVLPDIDELVEKVFTREIFKPCPRGTSVILPLYGQHFTHQGLKTDIKNQHLTWGSHTVDLSHLYGETLAKQLALRSMKGGKMKMQMLKGEEYPPNVKDTPGLNYPHLAAMAEEERFSLGHPFFSLFPSLLYWSTIWLREHNRVCDILAKEHPNWDDERLFQTTRLIILAETLKVTVEQYVQHVGGMYFQLTYEPDLLLDSTMRWGSSKIHTEFDTIYHWHSTIPDNFLIGGQNYSLKESLFNMKPLINHGMANFTTSLSNQITGRGAGGRNIAKVLLHVPKATIKQNRMIRLQSFNRYRQYFRLPPYKTFEDLTGEKKLAKILSDLYEGDVDAVEFYIGLMVEKRFRHKMWGITLIESIAPYALRSVYSNIIGSPQYWKESTFGGKIGFDIATSVTIQDLVCRNVNGCPTLSFEIPSYINEENDRMQYDDLEDVVESPCNSCDGKTEL